MKKYFLYLFISALAFTACNQEELNIPQKGVTTLDDFYKTDEDAEAALVAVYYDTHQNFISIPEINGWNYGPYFGLTNYQADDIYLAGSGSEDCVSEREFHDFRYANDNSVPEGGYTMFYRSIHKCNYVINNFTTERLGTITPTMERCVAEARVMRAYDHMMLAIYWGTPPIVEVVLSGSDRPENSESQDAVMQWVADEIDKALPNLDERKDITDYEGAVKITKGFANAVKGKALLWKKDYAGAKAALKEVINSGKYALNPSISTICHADGKGGPESVFEFNAVFVAGVVEDLGSRTGRNDIMTFNWRFENMFPMKDPQIKSEGWGWINPTGDFARKLIENDGMDSDRRKAFIKTYDEVLFDHLWASDFDGETPLNLTLAEKEVDPERGIAAGKFIYGNEGYFNWKTVIHDDQGDWLRVGWAGTWNKNLSIMRYAEVLLLYAEACAMTNDNDGLQYLNLIQNRAGSAHVSTECTLEEVQKEKQFELWLEGARSADLIRWGKTETLENQDYYLPQLRDELAEGIGSIHKGYVDESNATYFIDLFGQDKMGFKKGKHELLPFPKKVTDLNPALIQNPGWD